MAMSLRLALAHVVVARWSNDLFVFFTIFGLFVLTLMIIDRWKFS
jgi:hypothetical protein